MIEYARTRGATRIVVGAPRRGGWRALLRPPTSVQLVRKGAGYDVSVIARQRPEASAPRKDIVTPREIRWRRYWAAVAISGLCTALAALMFPYFDLTNLVMVYLLGATIAALKLGRGPASVTAIANVATFDFFFVRPRFTMAVSDVQYLVTFAVMLIVALTIATLVANVRAQTRVAGARERRTSLLYAMSRELVATRTLPGLARVAVRHVAESFDSEAAVLLPDSSDQLHNALPVPITAAAPGADLSVARWVYDHGRPAGLGTDVRPQPDDAVVPDHASVICRRVAIK